MYFDHTSATGHIRDLLSPSELCLAAKSAQVPTSVRNVTYKLT